MEDISMNFNSDEEQEIERTLKRKKTNKILKMMMLKVLKKMIIL